MNFKTLNINQILESKTYRLKIVYLFQRLGLKALQLNKPKIRFFFISGSLKCTFNVYGAHKPVSIHSPKLPGERQSNY